MEEGASALSSIFLFLAWLMQRLEAVHLVERLGSFGAN
jgi:hypothetical protein